MKKKYGDFIHDTESRRRENYVLDAAHVTLGFQRRAGSIRGQTALGAVVRIKNGPKCASH